MAQTNPGWEVIDGGPPDPAQPQPGSGLNAAAIQTLLVALKVISQRALIALYGLRDLGIVCLVFWLWYKIPDPNTNQIVANSIFSTFGLMAIVLMRWMR